MTDAKTTTVRAATMRDALRRIRDELGGDAVIVSRRDLPGRALPFGGGKGEVEVVAAKGEPTPQAAPVNRLRPAAFNGLNASETRAANIVRELAAGGRLTLPETTSPLLDRLRACDFPEPAARDYAALGDEPAVLAALRNDLPCGPAVASGRTVRTVAAFVGPTGVGKTTTLAKLAARLVLRQGRRVGLVTADSFRVGAVEQLATYARILETPLETVTAPAELPAALGRLHACDVVLVDTAGRAPRDDAHLAELAALLSHHAPDGTAVEAHLVLSVTAGPRSLAAAAARYGRLGVAGTVLTKLDEADGCGAAVDLLRNHAPAPVRLLGTGQDVPDDLAAATPEGLAAACLGDWRRLTSPLNFGPLNPARETAANMS